MCQSFASVGWNLSSLSKQLVRQKNEQTDKLIVHNLFPHPPQVLTRMEHTYDIVHYTNMSKLYKSKCDPKSSLKWLFKNSKFQFQSAQSILCLFSAIINIQSPNRNLKVKWIHVLHVKPYYKTCYHVCKVKLLFYTTTYNEVMGQVKSKESMSLVKFRMFIRLRGNNQ